MTTLNLMHNGKPLTLDPTKLSGAQLTAFRILMMLGEFKLDMRSYCSVNAMEQKPEPRCGTTFCLVGWLAFLDGYPDYYVELLENGRTRTFQYQNYGLALVDNKKAFFDFLFDEDWPNNWDAVETRAHYVLLHNDVPPLKNWITEFGLPMGAGLDETHCITDLFIKPSW
ncbi:MAG: hypothetical protein JKY54_16010 [Flavobacteriales bacterium]|nr:hypothetical protein [Flavobacteriales bacterium]